MREISAKGPNVFYCKSETSVLIKVTEYNEDVTYPPTIETE